MIIVDASVALKWFVHERGSEIADEILTAVQNKPENFAVPELFFAEMLHVLCKIYRSRDEVSESMGILAQLGLERIGLGQELLARSAEIAIDYKVGGYDAIYLATAEQTEGVWYTFDTLAHNRVQRLRISKLLW